MTQTIPSPDEKTEPVDQKLVPPEERFWQRYSPHAELPLSGASSLALHLLVFGLMLLSAWLAYNLFRQAGRALPVDAVRLEPDGAKPSGPGDVPGAGAIPIENGQGADAPANPVEQSEKLPPLKVKADPTRTLRFEDPEKQVQDRNDVASAQAFQRLSEVNRRVRLADKQIGPGPGKGGNGPGAGTGPGGTGERNERVDRMLRWAMMFDTKNGRDYVAQLHGLGAILAVPVREVANRPSETEYKIIRDLSARPAKLLDEDISTIQRIYWIDDKPQSVADVMTVLGVRSKPSYFIAFMPEELENKLFKLEKAYLEKHHKGRTEKDIVETRFRIKKANKGYEPEVIDQRIK